MEMLTPVVKQNNYKLLQMLDKGIDDMLANREMPLEQALEKITELIVKSHEIHILRVLREETDWQTIIKRQHYTY